MVIIAIGLSTAALFYARMKTASLEVASRAFDHSSVAIAQTILQIRLQIGFELALAAETPLASASTFDARVHAAGALWPILTSHPYVVEAAAAYPDGDIFVLRRVQTGDATPSKERVNAAYILRAADRTHGVVHGRYYLYDDRKRLLASGDDPSFEADPRTRPWFPIAKIDFVSVTLPFRLYVDKQLAVAASQRAPAGAVFAANVAVARLSEALDRLRPTPKSIEALIGPRGTVLAYSDPSQLDSIENRLAGRLATLDDLGSPALSTALHLAQQRQNMDTSGTFHDARGQVWLYRVVPGRDARGNVALYPVKIGGTTVNRPRRLLLLAAAEDEVIADALRVRNDALLLCLVLMLALIPATFFLSRLVSKPLGSLRDDALALRNLDFGDRPPRESFIQEIEEFSETFGTMRAHVRAHNDAVTNFVPHEFLVQLNRPDLRSVQLGDHREASMAMLFSDIRAFTTLSGKLTPEETFRFVNSYLSRIGPIVREHGGFIDKYIGDAIFALFPQNAVDALDAAIAMQRRIIVYNQERARAGYIPIAIGIGLHQGDLLLGTIGETERFETTVISGGVNVVARLESLNKAFGTKILATDSVIRQVETARYHIRRLGDVLVKGAIEGLTVYEVCDADLPELLARKMRTKEVFEVGRIAYAGGDFAEAVSLFGDIVAGNTDDTVAAYFLRRSTAMAAAAKTSEWDGIEHLEAV